MSAKKEQFESEYTLVGMSRSSVKFQNRRSGEIVYMHRNAVNKLENMVDYRVVDQPSLSCVATKWFEVLSWGIL